MPRKTIPAVAQPAIDAMTELAMDKKYGASKAEIRKSESNLKKRLRSLAKKNKKWAIALGYVVAGSLAAATAWVGSGYITQARMKPLLESLGSGKLRSWANSWVGSIQSGRTAIGGAATRTRTAFGAAAKGSRAWASSQWAKMPGFTRAKKVIVEPEAPKKKHWTHYIPIV